MGSERRSRSRYTFNALRARACLLWCAAVTFCWGSYLWVRTREVCPTGMLCIPNGVGGSPSHTAPYIEYSDVTSSAAVYRVSSLLKTVQSPYQLVQVHSPLPRHTPTLTRVAMCNRHTTAPPHPAAPPQQ